MMRKLFTLGLMTLFLLGMGEVMGQIATYEFEDVASPTGVDANINATNVTVVPSAAIGYQNGTDDGGAKIGFVASWNTGAFSTAEKYLQFQISPKTGYEITFTEIRLRFGRTAAGPSRVTVQISTDGFATAGTTVLDNAIVSSTATGSLDAFSISTGLPSDLESPLTVRIWGHNASGTGNLRFNNFEVFGSPVLPVDLLSFTAKADNNQTRLDWATATEQNSSHFLIQRSVDGGRTFATIGQVAGQGDSNERVDYTFVDEKPAAGTNYYRLHQFDYDGTNEFFGPVSVTFAGKGDAVRVWPTLAESELTIETAMDSDAAVLLSVYDLNGRLMQEQIASEKALQTTMSVANLPAGAYFIRWQQGGASGQVRFVKL